MPDKESFADIATKYAEDVVNGKIVAGKYAILACERHISDLDRQGTEDFPYLWNPLMQDSECEQYRPAERSNYFIELLPHVKGKWARERKRLELEPWQIFLIASVFGWIHMETGLRRFKTVYDEIARKNAKTTVASGVGLYLTARDDEEGAEVYSAATTADQAKISWSIAKQMTDKSPGFQQRFGMKTYSHSIARESNGSIFQYLAADSKGLDGLNVSGAIIDELHAHRNRDVFDVIETGTGSREQPIIFIITTAGTNRAGICYEQRSYLIKILTGQVVDETYFGIIYTIDDDDEWWDPEIWIKANPNLDVSVSIEDLHRKCEKAKAVPSAQNNFMTKHLNVWVNADVAWMNMVDWDKCADESLTPEIFKGEDCYCALDLSSKIDIAAKIQLFKRRIEDEDHFYAFLTSWLPEETIHNTPNDQYEGWLKTGHLIGTPGNIIDFAYIEEDLNQTASDYEIIEVPYDPFQATQLSTRLMAEGFPMVEMRPTVLNFSEPMKELEAVVIDGRFHHNGDPVLSWMVSNVVCHTDAKDNIYPRKEHGHLKIDGVIALIMAMGRAITREKPVESVYAKRGIISV